ncbi:MAG: site-specific integrase, partial [Chloroflexota bacterium]
MPRKSNGEGCITRRPNGLWQASLQLDGKRRTVYGKTRQEVADKLRTLQGAARENGHLPDPGRLTLQEYLHQWLEQAEGRLRPKTRQEYIDVANVHILPHIGPVRLSRLTPLHLARLYTRLQKDGVSSFRREKAHTLLHKLLADAHKWGLLANNPAALVDGPKREHRERQLWAP